MVGLALAALFSTSAAFNPNGVFSFLINSMTIVAPGAIGSSFPARSRLPVACQVCCTQQRSCFALGSSGIPRRSRPVRLCSSPQPELNERQASIMKAAGYLWDAERKRWYRGNPESKKRRALECRSGLRVARFDDASVQATESESMSLAVRHLQEVLQQARTEAQGGDERDREDSVRFKQLLASRFALPVWLGAQLLLGALLLDTAQSVGLDSGWREAFRIDSPVLLLGLGFAVPHAAAMRAVRVAQRGVEPLQGCLERSLADASLGSHALPAPAEWRYTSARWRALACALEAPGNLLSALALHCVVQPMFLDALSLGSLGSDAQQAFGSSSHTAEALFTPLLPLFWAVLAWQLLGAAAAASPLAALGALVLTATLPAVREAWACQPPRDGLDAELEAAARAARNAESYFSMRHPSDTSGEATLAAAAALRALAAAWEQRFGPNRDALSVQPLAAALACASAAAAWYLGGGSATAVLLVHGGGLFDAYVLDCEAATSQATISIPPPKLTSKTGSL